MSSPLEKYVAHYIRPVPTPPGMTSREIVRRAIKFENPPRLPYSFSTPLESDFFETTSLKYLLPPQRRAELGYLMPVTEVGATYFDEWGVGHQVTGRRWDNAFVHPLKELGNLDTYKFPDVAVEERFAWMAPHIHRAAEAGKFVVGGDVILMFERMRALLGFEELMLAPYLQPEGLIRLLDILTDQVIAVIERWASLGGVDAFMTWEDFGFQDQLQMRINVFREFYKPYYARIVEAAHDNGMAYIWHNCGQILDMLPDMIDIGVDVVQMDQPRLMGHKRVAAAGQGKICFWNAVDIQWAGGSNPTEEEYLDEVTDMVSAFADLNGGFMARQYPAPQDSGLTVDDQNAIYRAFMKRGCELKQEA